MQIPGLSPPDSPKGSGSLLPRHGLSANSGTTARIPHSFPATPSGSHLDFKESFFSVVHPPDTAPATPTRDEESSIDGLDEGLVISSRSRTGSPAQASFPSGPKGHRSTTSADETSIGLGLFGLGTSLAKLLNLDPSKGDGPIKGKRTLTSPLPGSHTHHSHKPTLLSSVLSRRARPVLALLAFSLAAVIVLLSFLSPSKSSPPPLTVADLRRNDRNASPARSTIKSKKTQPWVWGPGQELAAVISFLTSEHTHSLPPLSAEGVVDPELVLDFDPYSPSAPTALDEMVEQTWDERVVVVLGKGQTDPKSRKVQQSLEDMWIDPSPVYLDVTHRLDADHLMPVLQRLLDFEGDSHLPIILIGGKRASGLVNQDLLKDDSVHTWTSTEVQLAGAGFLPLKMRKKKKSH